MLRLVLDTNCSVAGFLWSGAPSGILSLAERHRIELCACDATLSEFRRVIAYPRIQKQLERRFLSASVVGRDFERLHTFFPDPENCPLDPPLVPDDPDDDLFYLLAEAAGADYLITRDNHLHSADDHAGIPSVDPGDFMRAYRHTEEGRGRPPEWGGAGGGYGGAGRTDASGERLGVDRFSEEDRRPGDLTRTGTLILTNRGDSCADPAR